MFGERFESYARSTSSELWRLDIRIEGQSLPLSDYDIINALIVRNNFLSQDSAKVAIFNPPDTLAEILMLVAAGLSSYMAAMDTPAMSEAEFKPGTLVQFRGILMKVLGWKEGFLEREKKLVLANEDRLKTKRFLPPQMLGEVSRYSGYRETPDKYNAKTRIPEIQKTVAALLGTEGKKSVSPVAEGAFLVCSANSLLIQLLGKTTVGGTSFFELFPSVRWTKLNPIRLGRDDKRRSYIFYFVGSLSSADDLLRTQEGANIRALIAGGRKISGSISLLDSMLSIYPLKNVFISIESGSAKLFTKLRNLGFKRMWMWSHKDFYAMKTKRLLTNGKGCLTAIDHHCRAIQSLKDAKYFVEDVAYPSSFLSKNHGEILQNMVNLNRLNRGFQNAILNEFLKAVYGLLNKLFQAPFPAVAFNGTARSIYTNRDKIVSQAVLLKEQFPMQSYSIGRIQELVEKAVRACAADKGTFEVLSATLKRLNSPDSWILVKRASFIEPLETLLSLSGHTQYSGIVANPSQVGAGCDTLIWTFRPDLRLFSEAIFKAKTTVFICHSQQRAEFEVIRQEYNRMVSQYLKPESRASVLKIPSDLFVSNISDQSATNTPVKELVELEEFLLTQNSFPMVGSAGLGSEIVSATQVLFSGGFTAFFVPSSLIKVVNPEDESIDQKSVDELRTGDSVVFLKEERHTVFEEMVEYYGHKPEIVEILKLSETWRTALLEYYKSNAISISELKARLEQAGLNRSEASLENWLDGKIICPPQDNYRPIDIISEVTGNAFLSKNIEKVKEAARNVHSLRIRIGQYLARRIIQSIATGEGIEGDKVLEGKLDKMSSYAEIAEVVAIAPDEVKISQSLANKLLGTEDI